MYPVDQTLAGVAKQCIEDSKLWFPGQSQSLTHMTLAMCGEVGELANLVKKIERGSLDPRTAAVYNQLVMENTDVFIYNMNIAGLLKYDPLKAYQTKRRENAARFGRGSRSNGSRGQ